MKKLLIINLLLFLTISSSAQRTIADVDATHQKVLTKWLATKKGWRLALEKDFDKTTLKSLRADEDRRPFYVAEDFNGDGQTDFAVILINSRRRFAAAVFNAPLSSGKAQLPAFFTDKIEIGDIVYFNRNSNRLLIGPYQSDSGFVLEPKGKTYEPQFMDAEN